MTAPHSGPPLSQLVALAGIVAALLVAALSRIRESDRMRWVLAGLQVACLLPGWVLLEVWTRLRRR